MHEQLSVISAIHFQLCTLRPALQFAPLNSRYRHEWFRPECDCLSLHVLSMEHAFSPEFGGFLYMHYRVSGTLREFKCALFGVENCVVTGMYTRASLNPYPSWTDIGNKILVRNLLRG